MSKKHPKKSAPINYKKQQQKQQRLTDSKTKQQGAEQEYQNGTVSLQFSPVDTWFFRESRPHDAAGASELSSLFPPPIRTLMGAVRSFLGESIAIDWRTFNDGTDHQDFKLAVGDTQGLGKLSVRGAWVCRKTERLYPAPFYLLHKDGDFARLQIGHNVECDLGKVRLPELPQDKDKKGYKGLEQTWVTSEGWRKLLAGGIPAKEELIKAVDLFCHESRLGIARDNGSRRVLEGNLYQTQHLRLQEDVTVQLDLKNLDAQLAEKLPQQSHKILRLGGEGRMAILEKKSHPLPLPSLVADNQPLKKIIIHFITPAYFGEQDYNGRMFPENFDKQEVNGQTVWQGALLDVELIIEAAVIGKTHREGGWDMQNHQPRAVKSYLPAGSAWFCRVVTDISSKGLLEKLHGQCIGEETAWGRGHILIGLWNDTKIQGK